MLTSIIQRESIILELEVSIKYYIGIRSINQASVMTAHIVLYKESIIFQFNIIIQISIMRTKRVL